MARTSEFGGAAAEELPTTQATDTAVYAQNPNTGYVEGGAAPLTSAQIAAAPAGATTAPTVAAAPVVSQPVAVPAAPAAPAAAPVAPVANVTIPQGTDQNALQMLSSLFQGYGLTGDIAGGITGLLQGGLTSDTIQAILESPNPSQALSGMNLTPAQQSAAGNLVSSWQARFSGNAARIKAGLTPLSPADYINTENSYKAVMQQAGLPAASMDPAYLGQLIGRDVSPAETQQRVSAAMTALQSEDPQVIAQLQSQYGLSTGTIAMHLLDPNLASNVIQQEVTAAQIGAEAARQNVNIAYGGTGPMSAMSLAAQGITQSQAAQGFQNIATQINPLQSLAGRYAGYTSPETVGAALGAATFGTQGAAQAQQELERLKTQEVSAFSGSAGASTGSLGMRDTSGQL